MKNQIATLLRELSIYSSPITEERIIRQVIDNCKRERINRNKEEIEYKGYNIFKGRDFRAIDVLESGIASGYVDVVKFSTTNREVQLSESGKLFLFAYYTNDFSQEYQEYEANVNQYMISHGEIPIQRTHIASSFWRGSRVENFCEHYLSGSSYQDGTKSYHDHLLELAGGNRSDNAFIFHFMPKLFLPVADIKEKVTLEIEGIETPENLILLKPYPNKRYVVAGIQYGKEKTAAGFYPFLSDKTGFSEPLIVTLRWKVGDLYVVTHRITLQFSFPPQIGNFFSSEQHLSRSNTLPAFSLTTFVEKSDLYRDRNVAVTLVNQLNDYWIEESATLMPFPMKLHHVFYADPYSAKWIEQNENRATIKE